MRPRFARLAPLLVAAVSCRAPAPVSPLSSAMDIHSHAEPRRVRTTHADLDLTLDFDRREARGTVALRLERPDPAAPLVLDVNGLVVEKVEGEDGSPRTFTLGADVPYLGPPLTIALAPGDRLVRIAYRTTENAAALQWLEPAQTAGGAKPFLFTQGQSILTRSWVPLQDSPAVRITFEARVRAPKELTVVMAAESLERDRDGAFRFRMTHPIPPYLFALACGELEFLPISDRCGVWAEKPVVARARSDFEDTESMVRAAERLFGPYRWGRYDLLVLPPSFPYGGMENPCLTFATPTVLTGDKSLVSLVAHELAHSWSGNLVTNATWSDFWLNEGFTVYFEERIMESVYGADRARLEMQAARADLEREMKDLQPWEQILRIDLRGKDPDDGFNGVPYEKGALFLRRIEELFGRERFDRFLTSWFDSHAFRSVGTDDFLAYLKHELLDGAPDRASKIDLVEWIERPGIPADAPRYRSQALGRVDEALAAWKAGKPVRSLETRDWVTQQWLYFLRSIPDDAAKPERLAELDEAFGLTKTPNTEIACAWLEIAIKRGYHAADARLQEFLMANGRRKYLKPLYTELAKTEEGKARAKVIYEKARPRYHSVSAVVVDKILK